MSSIDAVVVRAQCQAQSDLDTPLRDRVSDHTIDADASQEKCNRCKDTPLTAEARPMT
jgi:hypothetical protein